MRSSAGRPRSSSIARITAFRQGLSERALVYVVQVTTGDLMFGTARHFRELLRSQEGISTNVLTDRLRKLVAYGMISAAADPTHKQKTVYSLTEMGIALVPVMVRLGAWGRRFLPASDELSVRIEVLERGGPPMWDDFMDELRQIHLCQDAGSRHGPTVHERLQAAYDARLSAGGDRDEA